MTDASQPSAKARVVNIDSAIGRSSFDLPVFVALSADDGEAQVVKTFATARDVFDRIFSVMLNRLLQRHAVEKVEKLVPASAHLKNSITIDYVLFVRGKAIFWFSGAAAKRAAGRTLLLEHARDLADAELAPFYVLNTRARRIRVAAIAVGLVVLAVAVMLVWHLSIDWARPFERRDAAPAAPSSSDFNTMHDRTSEARAGPGTARRMQPEPFAESDIRNGTTPANELFPEPVFQADVMARRPPAMAASPGRVAREPVSRIPAQVPDRAPDGRDGGTDNPMLQIDATTAEKPLTRKPNSAFVAPVLPGPPPSNLTE